MHLILCSIQHKPTYCYMYALS